MKTIDNEADAHLTLAYMTARARCVMLKALPCRQLHQHLLLCHGINTNMPHFDARPAILVLCMYSQQLLLPALPFGLQLHT